MDKGLPITNIQTLEPYSPMCDMKDKGNINNNPNNGIKANLDPKLNQGNKEDRSILLTQH